jgi:hypothetical protein
MPPIVSCATCASRWPNYSAATGLQSCSGRTCIDAVALAKAIFVALDDESIARLASHKADYLAVGAGVAHLLALAAEAELGCRASALVAA